MTDQHCTADSEDPAGLIRVRNVGAESTILVEQEVPAVVVDALIGALDRDSCPADRTLRWGATARWVASANGNLLREVQVAVTRNHGWVATYIRHRSRVTLYLNPHIESPNERPYYDPNDPFSDTLRRKAKKQRARDILNPDKQPPGSRR